MITNYYFEEGGKTTQIAADRFTQILPSGEIPFSGGQCEIKYKISFTVTERGHFNYYREASRRSSNRCILGPISSVYIRLDDGQYGPQTISRYIFAIARGKKEFINDSGNKVQMSNLRDIEILPCYDNELDNCGDRPTACRTTFYRNEQAIHTLDSCPPVSTSPPCSDCCCSLLPLLRSIRI